MSYPDPEIVKSDGLLRLKWEEERERASCPDLLCFGTADMGIIAARNRFLHH